MKMIQKMLVLGAAIALSSATQAGAADLFVNGGFDSDLSHWTAVGKNSSLPARDSDALSHGTSPGYAAFDKTGKFDSLGQSIALVANAHYLLSFYCVSSKDERGANQASFYIYQGTEPNDTIIPDGKNFADNQWDGWKSFSFPFTPTITGTYKFVFEAKNTKLDTLSLTAVPEPYHYGLASLLGLMGLVVADRMRHRKLAL